MPIGTSTFEKVEYEGLTDENFERGEDFSIFCYLQGMYQDAERVELKALPDVRYNVSTRDDGRGRIPRGLDSLVKEREFMFEPVVATLNRYTTRASRRQRYFLQQVAFLKDGSASLDAVPSQLFPGAISFLGTHTLTLSGASLSFDRQAVDGVDGAAPNYAGVAESLRAFASFILGAELGVRPEHARWVPPLQRRDEPLMIQAALAIADNPASQIPLPDLVARIQNSRGRPTRKSYLRRLLLGWSEYFQLAELADDRDDIGEEVVGLTARGRQLVALTEIFRLSQPA
jgi:hypothetical protein